MRQRTREIGVRLALGATRVDIVRIAIRMGMTPVVIGAVIGVGGGVAVGRAMAGLVYGISATDPTALIMAMAVMSFVGLMASLGPAVAASRVDPVASLHV
jgi:ABC-type antimicrobial peptide transport system permease subunit